MAFDPVPMSIQRIPFPRWAKWRFTSGNPWIYAGWISSTPKIGTYANYIKDALKSDHGEIREVDEYPEGAVRWYRERSHTEERT